MDTLEHRDRKAALRYEKAWAERFAAYGKLQENEAVRRLCFQLSAEHRTRYEQLLAQLRHR